MQKNSLIQSRSGRAGPVRATALLTGRLPSIRCFQSAVILAQITGPCRRRLHRVLPWRASCARTCNVKSCSAGVPRGRSGGRMLRDGPPRMVARPTWSGRERSSHSRYLPVPRVGLVTPPLLFDLVLFRKSRIFLRFPFCCDRLPGLAGVSISLRPSICRAQNPVSCGRLIARPLRWHHRLYGSRRIASRSHPVVRAGVTDTILQ